MWERRSLKSRNNLKDCEPVYLPLSPSPTLPTPNSQAQLSPQPNTLHAVWILFHCLHFYLLEIPLGFSYLIVNFFFFLIVFCPAPKEAQLKAWDTGEAENFGVRSTDYLLLPDAVPPTFHPAQGCPRKLRGQRTGRPKGKEGGGERKGKEIFVSLLPALCCPSTTTASSAFLVQLNYGLDKLLWASVGIKATWVSFLFLVKIDWF